MTKSKIVMTALVGVLGAWLLGAGSALADDGNGSNDGNGGGTQITSASDQTTVPISVTVPAIVSISSNVTSISPTLPSTPDASGNLSASASQTITFTSNLETAKLTAEINDAAGGDWDSNIAVTAQAAGSGSNGSQTVQYSSAYSNSKATTLYTFDSRGHGTVSIDYGITVPPSVNAGTYQSNLVLTLTAA